MIAAVTSALPRPVPSPASLPRSTPAQGAPVKADPPKWPEPHSPGLTGEVLALKRTELAFTSDDTVFETGADFWDMLATATDRRDRAGHPGS